MAKALGDEDVAVQLAAQGALGRVAPPGDPRTVRQSLSKVSSGCEWTRIAALSTLADITQSYGEARGATDVHLD